MKTALIIGATGLVGKNLVDQLLEDERYRKVVLFLRRPSGLFSPKLTEHLIDFDKPENWSHLVKGDVLFSALGTTRKKAGSKKAQYKVDHGYQYKFAEAASRNNVAVYVLISAIGASVNSPFFYNRMKGELERDIRNLFFERTVILRPGPLEGHREEQRKGEQKTVHYIKKANRFGLLLKIRPITGGQVAKAMNNSVFLEKKGVSVFSGNELFNLAVDF